MMLDLAKFFLSLLTGVFLIAALPHDLPLPDFSTIVWVAFIPLFGAVALARRPFEAFLLGYLAGVVAHAGLIFWLIRFGPLPVIFITLGYAVPFGAIALGTWLIFRRLAPSSWWWAFPSLGVGVHLVTSLGVWGFPWVLPVYALSGEPVHIQMAEFGGIWLVSFIIYAVNVLAYQAVFHPGSSRIRLRSAAILILFIALNLAWGNLRMSRMPEGRQLTLGLIQSGIESDTAWTPSYSRDARKKYIDLSDGLADGTPVDLHVWPESATGEVINPEIPYSAHPEIRSFVVKSKAPLLVGYFTRREGRVYNSAVLLQPDGIVGAIWDKKALVPYGELVPFRRALTFFDFPWGDDDLERGVDYAPIRAWVAGGALELAVGVCFDSIYPFIFREQVKNGGNLILVITNNSWYKLPSGTWQHAMMDVFRAVENRRWVVRDSTTGITQVVDPAGRVVEQTEPFSGERIIKVEVESLSGQTFYTRHGAWFGWLCVIISVLSLGWALLLGESEGYI